MTSTALLYTFQEQKCIRARLAATSAGTNHLACLTRVVIGEATSSSVLLSFTLSSQNKFWRECLDVDNTFSLIIYNAKFYNFPNKEKRDFGITNMPKSLLLYRLCCFRFLRRNNLRRLPYFFYDKIRTAKIAVFK